MNNLIEIQFKSEFVNNFDGDDSGNTTPRQTPGMLYSKALPTPVKKVILLAWSDDLANELEIERPASEPSSDGDGTAQDDVNILGGNLVTASMQPYAACYAGHQFGHWAGQLGDGRAITLGELQTSSDKTYELQLKGAGPTAYSRTADGRAVLRSSLREYLMSEAMYYLGVPTTRALSLVSTGDEILRDMFYNGNPAFEPGAIVMRVAPTFLRFGNYEVLAARREIPNLRKLVDWTIERYYPHIEGEDKVLTWYKEVLERTAALMVEWLRVGFVHGVMNTDNMSILGLTIDYGPYSFVDDYDPNFTPNTTDLPGRRYAFGRQAAIAKWNLACLAGAISSLINDDTKLQEALETYDDAYWRNYYTMMASKLGFDEVSQKDVQFMERFEKMLKRIKPDMTIFFQLLIDLSIESTEQDTIRRHFAESFYTDLQEDEVELLNTIMKDYVERIKANKISREASIEIMSKSNPRFILRNYLLHEAIEELQSGKDTLFVKLQQAMKEPYTNKFDEFFVKRPSWATKQAGCSMLSCSS
jgi:uncharacterized protein YdiU (UPF0061 family)